MIQTPGLFRKTFKQPSNAGEEHSKFLTILPGNMDREILENIEIDS